MFVAIAFATDATATTATATAPTAASTSLTILRCGFSFCFLTRPLDRVLQASASLYYGLLCLIVVRVLRCPDLFVVKVRM